VPAVPGFGLWSRPLRSQPQNLGGRRVSTKIERQLAAGRLQISARRETAILRQDRRSLAEHGKTEIEVGICACAISSTTPHRKIARDPSA
jgi:hypothetical protein